jgi:hypothetical protein
LRARDHPRNVGVFALRGSRHSFFLSLTLGAAFFLLLPFSLLVTLAVALGQLCFAWFQGKTSVVKVSENE